MDSSKLNQWRRADVPNDQLVSAETQFNRHIGRVPRGLQRNLRRDFANLRRQIAAAGVELEAACAAGDGAKAKRAEKELRALDPALRCVLIETDFAASQGEALIPGRTSTPLAERVPPPSARGARCRERGSCTNTRSRGSRRVTRSSSRSGDGGDGPPGSPPSERGPA